MTARSPADALRRRVIPRAVVTLSRVDARARLGARARRRLGRRGRVELYVAFDDPCSAVAAVDLAQRLAGYEADLELLAVVRRGIAGDPAVAAKRRYAIEDAQRLFRRSGLTLRRTEPLAADDVAFLACWAAAAAPGTARTRFSVAALRRLWLETDGAVDAAQYEALWREAFGSPPPVADGDGTRALRRNERRMARRGPYDTPAAWVHGQWFFAHDRLAQIAARLDDLGWARPGA